MTEPQAPTWTATPTDSLYAVVPHPDGFAVAQILGVSTLKRLSVLVEGAVVSHVVDVAGCLPSGNYGGGGFTIARPVSFSRKDWATLAAHGANRALDVLGYADNFMLDDGRTPELTEAALAADTARQH